MSFLVKYQIFITYIFVIFIKMDSRLQNANYYIPKAKIPYRPIPSYYLAKDVKKVNDSCPLTQSY